MRECIVATAPHDVVTVNFEALKSVTDAEVRAHWDATAAMKMGDAVNPWHGPHRTVIVEAVERLYDLDEYSGFWCCVKRVSSASAGSRVRLLLMADRIQKLVGTRIEMREFVVPPRDGARSA